MVLGRKKGKNRPCHTPGDNSGVELVRLPKKCPPLGSNQRFSAVISRMWAGVISLFPASQKSTDGELRK